MNKRIIREAKRMAVIFAYLALIFGGFTTYRKLVLGEFGISYFGYGYGLVESLVLTKIILIGDWLRLGRTFRDRPLILPTLHKTVSFSLLVLVFSVVEHTIDGLFKGKDLAGAFGEILDKGTGEILAKTVVMFVAFVPLFALWEIDRTLGEGKLFDLFFKRRKAGTAENQEL